MPQKIAASASSSSRRQPTLVGQMLSMPPTWLAVYDDFITRNVGQVSQMESALRSLTYIIPGRFRDAEIASESIHSGVQLLSLYHDMLLNRTAPARPTLRSAHARYTRYWTGCNTAYRRIALVLQMVNYTQMLCEMAAKRRGGERSRWRVVVLLEALKAVCKLLLLSITRTRPLLTPVLPERDAVAPEVDGDDELLGRDNGTAQHASKPHESEWTMPRTGLSLPSLPDPNNINGFLLGRVLTADDIKPPRKLLNRLSGSAQAAEILHMLVPLIYALALARSYNAARKDPSRRSVPSWTPWLVGLAADWAARQLRERSFRTTTLERDEWHRRAWAMGWWTMRGAFYERVTGPAVRGVAARLPSFVAGVLEDYDYLWANYYFSTSP